MKRLTKAKLLVDTGDPGEAKKVQEMLKTAGYAGLDGATTNPSYFSLNPDVQARIAKGEKYKKKELLAAYCEAVEELETIIPGGDISVEVYADQNTTADEMVEQAREMAQWIPTARIKLPIIEQGLIAASTLKDEIRLNMTLCFSQQQAAAVYAATFNPLEPVFVSPFIGRLIDKGEDGAQFVGNITKMMHQGDGHVQVLAASFRSVDNIMEMIRVGTDVLTINMARFELWQEAGFKLPGDDFVWQFNGKDIPYEEVSLGKDWRKYNIQHEMTDVSLQKFIDDWNNLIG